MFTELVMFTNQNILIIFVQYELEGLEKMCLDVLASRLTIENAAETMMMADFCGSQDYNILFTKYVSE